MRTSALLLAICFVGSLVTACPALAQNEIANPQAIVSAQTIFFEDKSGVDNVARRALVELVKWGRFQIVQDPKKADLIVLLSTDPGQGGNLIVSGGQTATIDSGGHVQEDRVPTFNKLEPVRSASLTVTDVRTGAILWNCSQRWGGMLTGFDSVGERLIKEFEKQTLVAEERSRLKVIKSVNPAYPPEIVDQEIAGAVVVRVELDKNGKVTSAKALTGPPELFQASVDAAKQWQFEPPVHAPITTELSMKYGLEPPPCPPGKKGNHPNVFYAQHVPLKTARLGELKILADLFVPMPTYPEKSIEAGTEGELELFITVGPSGDVIVASVRGTVDPAIDKTALETVKTWKFKVTRGGPTVFRVKFRYQIRCLSSDDS